MFRLSRETRARPVHPRFAYSAPTHEPQKRELTACSRSSGRPSTTDRNAPRAEHPRRRELHRRRRAQTARAQHLGGHRVAARARRLRAARVQVDDRPRRGLDRPDHLLRRLAQREDMHYPSPSCCGPHLLRALTGGGRVHGGPDGVCGRGQWPRRRRRRGAGSGSTAGACVQLWLALGQCRSLTAAQRPKIY